MERRAGKPDKFPISKVEARGEESFFVSQTFPFCSRIYLLLGPTTYYCGMEYNQYNMYQQVPSTQFILRTRYSSSYYTTPAV